MIMDILSQSLSDRLDLCGIEINDDETIANRFLLSLAKRRLQMCEAFIADANANSIIFKRSFNGDPLACLISSDLSIDERVKPIIATMLHGAIRRYIGITLSLSNGRRGTLMLLSGEFSMISNKDIMIIQEIAAMIEDRHKIREEDEASAAKSMIVNTSILFTALQVYLSVATNISKKIQSCLQEEKCRGSPKFFNLPNARSFLTAQPTPRFTTTQHRLDHYCKRLQVVVENINTATDRLSTVARRYSEPDTKKYYLSCFQYRSEGFVDQVNEMLLEVSKLIPDHHLSWTFHLDAEVVDNSSGHRTFYQHLFFFLEGILLRWSDCCSSAHVSVSFDCEHSFHSSVDSQNRLELGYLMVRFQPEHVSQNSEEVEVAKSRSRQLVEMLGDFLRLTDHGARVEVLQAEKASGAGRGVCEGEGESVEAESYLIRLPCHFHLLTDPLLKQMMGLSVSSRSLSVYRGCTVAPLGWVDVGRSSGSRVYEQTFSVLTEAQSYRKSVILQNGISWKSHMAEVAVTNRSQPRDSNIHGVSWTSVGRLISSGRNWLSGIFGDSKVSIEVPTNNLMLSSDAQSKQTPETPRTVTGRHVSSSSSSSSSSYTNFLHLVVPGFLSRSPAVSPTGISL